MHISFVLPQYYKVLHFSLFCLQGQFGMVTLYMYDPTNDGTGELVAVKALKQENGNVDAWMKEIEILKSLYHSNIVKYKGICTEIGEALITQHGEHCSPFCSRICNRNVPCSPMTGGHVVQLIMEYLPLGSLRDYLRHRKQGMPQNLMFAQQICKVSCFMLFPIEYKSPLFLLFNISGNVLQNADLSGYALT